MTMDAEEIEELLDFQLTSHKEDDRDGRVKGRLWILFNSHPHKEDDAIFVL